MNIELGWGLIFLIRTDCLQKIFYGILFSSYLHKIHIETELCTVITKEMLLFYKRHLLSETEFAFSSESRVTIRAIFPGCVLARISILL